MTPDEKLKVLLKQGRGIEPRPGFEEAVWTRIHAASELATLEHIRRVSVLLTSDQRKKFLSDLTRCLCGGEGLCAGGCSHE